jgi:hypothetical protein
MFAFLYVCDSIFPSIENGENLHFKPTGPVLLQTKIIKQPQLVKYVLEYKIVKDVFLRFEILNKK